jgi:hypothetical protein
MIQRPAAGLAIMLQADESFRAAFGLPIDRSELR